MLSQRDKDKALNFEQLQVALRVAGMDAAKKAQVVAYARAIAALLYAETSSEQLETLECIETASRGHMQTHVNPEVAIFYLNG